MRYSIWWDAVCSLGGAVAILYGLTTIARSCAPKVSPTLLRVARNVLLVSYVGWYLFSFLVLAFQKSGDLGHCQDFVDALAQTNVVPESVSSPGRPAVFCLMAEYGILRSRYQVIETYSVPPFQYDKLATAVTIAHQRVNGAAVQLVFYDRENWQVQTAADGKTVIGGSRGPEKIQTVRVIR